MTQNIRKINNHVTIKPEINLFNYLLYKIIAKIIAHIILNENVCVFVCVCASGDGSLCARFGEGNEETQPEEEIAESGAGRDGDIHKEIG